MQALDLRGNQLTTLPAEIGGLTQLQVLDLQDNRLTTLPAEIGMLTQLRECSLSYNYLSHLPKEIIQLRHLRYLSTTKNPIEIPPPEIVMHGIRAIFSYFTEMEKSVLVDHLFEAKLLLVGEGRVGKTSLMKSLISPNYELEDEQSTEGIDIQRLIIPKDGKELSNDFYLNIWDFGGQEIYHATHQFFLTKRSLYLLVTESRKEDKHEDFYYWLNIIKLLGENSPVILVQNKCDQPIKALPIREYQDAFDNLTNSISQPAIPAARIKVLCNPIISSVQQPAGYLYPAFETLF